MVLRDRAAVRKGREVSFLLIGADRVGTAGRARRAPARMHVGPVHPRPRCGRSIQSLDAMSNFLGRLRASLTPTPRPSPVFDDGTDLSTLPQFVPDGFRHGVQILNDASTPVELVIELLQVV